MADTTTHQLVGVVTKMFPTFGYINNQIFFQRKCVIGPMVEVGDNVATSAVYQPNMPIKWSAEKVWRVQESRVGGKEEEKPSTRSPVRNRESRPRSRDRTSHPRDASVSRDSLSTHSDRKTRSVAERKRSRSRDLTSDRSDTKRRRTSPVRPRSRSPPRPGRTRNIYDLKTLLNIKEMLVPDIESRFRGLFPPVDLYRLVCHWQDSFPLLKPLQPDRSTSYQILKTSTESDVDNKNDTGFYVNVLLLSMPSVTTLQDKTIIRAQDPDQDKPSLRKYVRILSVSKPKEHYKAFGGPWSPEVDGDDPLNNPEVLIKTAIRICKEQLGLDLSSCSQWHRFLEFRYSRTEGSTARPTSVLFPGSQLWGRSFADKDDKSTNTMKPFHRIVIYFIPDIWSLMPSSSSWKDVKDAMEIALSTGSEQHFPMSAADVKTYIGQKEEASADTDSKANTDTSNQVTTGQPEGNCSAPVTQESATDKSKADAPSGVDESVSKATDDSKEEGGPTPATVPSTVEENASGNKSQKKSHEELNLSAMKVSELREQLKARNMPADGIKAQLLSRLKAAVEKEAEEAKRLEEERKRKEKELQDAQALKEAEQKQEALKVVQPAPVPKPVLTKVTLNDYPSIVVQNRLPSECTVQPVTLGTILETKAELMDSRAYEFIICAQSLLDMIRRDTIFTLFRALVSAGDRGVQAKSRPRLAPDRHSRHDSKADSTKDAIPFTVDVPLLFACTFLDTSNRQYFTTEETEEMITTLGLPVSRYQIRSLVTKVADGNRIFYRSLTDTEVSPLNVKSTSVFSEIDDDEYLLELIRGGDAILDDQKETHLPLGSVSIIPLDDTPITSTDATATAQGLRQLEFEKSKLRKQLQCKIEEIDRLRTLTEQIPILKQKLESANSSIVDYRQRFRTERDKTHYIERVLEQQLDNLDASRSALRQAVHRLRPRESETKKSTTDSKSRDSETKSNSSGKPETGKDSKNSAPPEAPKKDQNKDQSKTTIPETSVSVSAEKPNGEQDSAVEPKTQESKMVNGVSEGAAEDVPMLDASGDSKTASIETKA